MDVSADLPILDISGDMMDISGGIMDISGGMMDISGGMMDISGGMMDISGGMMDISGGTTVITLQDILSAAQIVKQKENTDKARLESIGAMSFDSLRDKLLQWVSINFPNAFHILDISVQPPAVCSDGVVRGLGEYITFCSGKTIHEHVAVLQAKLPDMVVSFANMGSYISIVISKV